MEGTAPEASSLESAVCLQDEVEPQGPADRQEADTIWLQQRGLGYKRKRLPLPAPPSLDPLVSSPAPPSLKAPGPRGHLRYVHGESLLFL